MLPRLILLLPAAGLLPAGSAVHELKPATGSRFALTVEKTGLLSGRKHLFLFSRYQGKLFYDPEAPERSRVELTVDAASAVCKDTWVSEKDLKKIQNYTLHDMLAVDNYPELRFRSTGVVLKFGNSFQVAGVLAIRGIEKPVTVSVTVANQPAALASVAGQAVVRLKDYGLRPPSAALGTIGTKNEMTVEFLLLPSAPVTVSETRRP